MMICKLKDNSEKNKLLWKILENIKTEIENNKKYFSDLEIDFNLIVI